MKDYLTIGSSPCDEDCVSVGDDNYMVKQKKECRDFIDLIRDKLGQEPRGASLCVKSFPHDLGSYCEVVCKYDDANEEATEYAFKCEGDAPTTWGEKKKKRVKKYITFGEWHKKVDMEVSGSIGVGLESIGDRCYRDEYDSGREPEDLANEILEEIEAGEF